MAMGIKKIGTVHETEWFREQREISERMNKEHIAKHARSFYGHLAKADNRENGHRNDGGDADAGKRVDHHASTVANLLVEAGSFPHRAAALQHLLHKPSGQALLSRMHKAAEQTGKESNMCASETLEGIMKSAGIGATCAGIAHRRQAAAKQLPQPSDEQAAAAGCLSAHRARETAS